MSAAVAASSLRSGVAPSSVSCAPLPSLLSGGVLAPFARNRLVAAHCPTLASHRKSCRLAGGAVQKTSASPSSLIGSGPAASGQSSKGKAKRRPQRQSVSLNETLLARKRIAQCSLVRP